MEQEINDIDNLIGKVLAGEATPEEQRLLEVWLQKDKENPHYFHQLKAIFEKAGAHQVQLQFDTDAAWAKVRSKLHTSDDNVRSLWPPVQTKPLLRMAAGVVFILGAGFFAYQWRTLSPEPLAITADKTTLQHKLPDGTTAFLNRKSTISYSYRPSEKARRVTLKGEAFFEIKHQDEQSFVIEAEDVLVKDIGTSFNVKAFPDSDTVEVAVQTGEVQIYTLSDVGLHLNAGEAGIYNRRLHEFSRLVKADTNVLAYKTGILSFNNTYLKVVIESINEVYDSKIKLDNTALNTCRLTANFHGDSLDTIVEIIAETLKLTVTRKNNEIILHGPGCN